MKKKFSIIIIAYNNPHEISATLGSINILDYPKDLFEVIVVDDGSEVRLESTIKIPLNYTHQFYYIERTPTSSRSNARNKGAAFAAYDWLIFIDGDQYLNSTLLNIYNDYIHANNDRSVVLGTRIDLSDWQSKLLLDSMDIDRTCKLIRNQTDSRILIKHTFKEKLENTPGIWTLFWSHNFAISLNAFLNVGKFDNEFIDWGFEDVEFGYRLSKAGYKYDIIENNVFHFYEINKITSAKHYGWIKNLEYFYKKHNDMAIMCQWFFYEALSVYDHLNKPGAKEMHDMFVRYTSKIQFLEKMKLEK